MRSSQVASGLLCAGLAGGALFAQTVCPITPDRQHIDSLIGRMRVSEKVAQLQDRAPAIERLGLPAYNWWNEGLHGVARNGYATVFPQAIGLAATFDASLLHEVAETISTEARAKYNGRAAAPHGDSVRYNGLTVWSPNINIFRDPRWGRGQETYGEDPFLTASLGYAFISGLQGTDPFYRRADATPKHFVAHSGPEQGRDSFNAVVSAHDLEDTYLQAFHTAVGSGHATALMCSYNAINGIPSCANAGLLEGVVRKSWGFDGYVVSDCDAVGNLTSYHHFAKDTVHGAAAALNAGVDLDCGNSYLPLQQALVQHLVSETTIDRSLHRLLEARLRLGALDAESCSPYDDIPAAENDTPAHRALALKAAEESIVLLKNDGILPLKPAMQRIAVIGPTADMLKVLEANYHGTASKPVTPLDGITEGFAHIHYAQGSLLAAGVPVPIPSTAFRTGPGLEDARGLRAEYFSTDSFNGQPSVAETVSKIDFDLDRVSPSPLLSSKRFAARWSGYFVPPAVGDYLLRINLERCWDCTTHDHFSFYLDDKKVIVNDGDRAEPNHVMVHIDGLQPHAIRLELIHSGDDEGIALEWEPPATALLEEAVAAAKAADVIVAFVGLSPDLEGEALQLQLDGFAGGDRTTLDLPASQRALLARLRELRKPMTIVLTSGSAISLSPSELAANAIVEAWYPGEEGGHALANLLAGKTNPSGRLPVSFYRSVADLPDFSDYSMAHRTYRYFDRPVLFPFGFGLSYTKFQYEPVHLSKPRVAAGDGLSATVRVRNAGSVAGSEVTELYLVPPSLPGMPLLALQGVRRLTLRPGESRVLTFDLSAHQMSFVDPEGKRGVRAGKYRVFIGGGQPMPSAQQGAPFEILGSKAE